MLNLVKVFIFRHFSTSDNDKLHPWFITGLIDAEGCFNISISESFKKSKLGPIYLLTLPSLTPLHSFWISGFVSGEGSFNISVNPKNQVFPVFSIGLLIRDKLLLLKIQEYFGFGRVYLSGKTAQFKVFRLVDLLSIISNFNSYPAWHRFTMQPCR